MDSLGTDPRNVGKGDTSACRGIPRSIEERFEWWLLSTILLTLWLEPWSFLLMPQPMQFYVRGVLFAVPLAWFLKQSLPRAAVRVGRGAMITILIGSFGLALASGLQGSAIKLVIIAIWLAIFFCGLRRDAPNGRFPGRPMAIISDADRTMVSLALLAFTLIPCIILKDPFAYALCIWMIMVHAKPETRDRLRTQFDLDLVFATCFSFFALSCRGEFIAGSALAFFMALPLGWLTLYLEPSRPGEAPVDARSRRRRLLLALVAAQYLLFPDMLGKAAPQMYDSGTLAGVERLIALHPASAELRTLRERYLGSLGRLPSPVDETTNPHSRPCMRTRTSPAPKGAPAKNPTGSPKRRTNPPRIHAAGDAACSTPAPTVIPFHRLTMEVALDSAVKPWRITADLRLALEPPPGGFGAGAPPLPGAWSRLGTDESGVAHFRRRAAFSFAPDETNGLHFIEGAFPVPAGYAVERWSTSILRRDGGTATLHVATNERAATLRAADPPVTWEETLTCLTLTVSAAPPVRLECAGRALTVHAAGWEGLADRFGSLRLGIERLSAILPCPRREFTVFLGGLRGIDLGGFKMGNAIWVMGERHPTSMTPHFRHVFHDLDPHAPLGSDERFNTLMHEMIHALLDHPHVMHNGARLYEGIVTYLAERVARVGPDDVSDLDAAWTGLPRPALGIDPRADRNALCEASYGAGRDLFRAVERDLGAPAADRLIGRLFAPGPSPGLVPLLRELYAGRTPHPVVARLVGPLDPFAAPPPADPPVAETGSSSIAAR